MSYEVVVLDNFKTGEMQNISQHLKNAPFKLVVGDAKSEMPWMGLMLLCIWRH
jgi:hypothetical protein